MSISANSHRAVATATATTATVATPSKPKRITRAKLPAILREQVWLTYVGDRLYGKCFCCQSAQISIMRNTEFAHVIPVARGGQDTVENLRPCCESCNRGMGTTNLFEYMERLRKSGVIPTSEYATFVREVAQGETTTGDARAPVGSACASLCEPMEIIGTESKHKPNPWIL